MATYQEKIRGAEAEILQLQNRAKEYRQKLKKQERTARTRRICQRGGYIEKVLPETITLTDENFRAFIDKVILTGFSRNKLAELKAAQDNQAADEIPGALAPSGTAPTAKQPEAKHTTG